MLNIGLFGGTFDPIHMGHILPIKKAAEQLSLDNIHIIPANIPPHKSKTQSNSFHRSKMVKIVCQHEPLFSFDGRELQRKKASYTVDSLREIVKEFSDKKQNVNLYFFMGMDSLNTFTSWYQWQEILSLCSLVVMPRPGYTLDATLPTKLLNQVIDYSNENSDFIHTPINSKNRTCTLSDNNVSMKNIFIMHDMATNISSTSIRELLAQRKQAGVEENKITATKTPKNSENKGTLASILPTGIYEYIIAQQLY